MATKHIFELFNEYHLLKTDKDRLKFFVENKDNKLFEFLVLSAKSHDHRWLVNGITNTQSFGKPSQAGSTYLLSEGSSSIQKQFDAGNLKIFTDSSVDPSERQASYYNLLLTLPSKESVFINKEIALRRSELHMFRASMFNAVFDTKMVNVYHHRRGIHHLDGIIEECFRFYLQNPKKTKFPNQAYIIPAFRKAIDEGRTFEEFANEFMRIKKKIRYKPSKRKKIKNHVKQRYSNCYKIEVPEYRKL